jgi:hypothetical protein
MGTRETGRIEAIHNEDERFIERSSRDGAEIPASAGTTTHSSTEDKSATREFWLTLAGVENSLSAKRKFAAQHPAARYVDFHHHERKGKSFASTRNCCVPQFASCCSLQTASCPGALR